MGLTMAIITLLCLMYVLIIQTHLRDNSMNRLVFIMVRESDCIDKEIMVLKMKNIVV